MLPSRPHTIPKPLTAVALVAVALFASASAQNETRRHGIFIDSIDVSLVNVDVVVTQDGRPVPGLTAEDFEVTDDGEPVAVTHFYAVQGGYRQAGEALAEPAGPAPDVPREDASIVVLVDNPFISATSRKRVFDALGRQLDALMDGGARVMLVTKDRQIRVVQPFTTDRDAIRAVLVEAEEAGASLDRYYLGSVAVVRQIESTVPGRSMSGGGPGGGQSGGGSEAVAQARQAANALRAVTSEQYEEVRSSLFVLGTFINSLAGLPGRKAVLYVCDRLPLRPGEGEWQIWFRKFGLELGRQLGINSVDDQVRE